MASARIRNWSLSAGLAVLGLAIAPGIKVQLHPANGARLDLSLSLIGEAQAATRKKAIKKAAATKKVAAKTRRVCTSRKVKGKTVRTCKTVAAAAVVPPPPPPVVITAASSPSGPVLAPPAQPPVVLAPVPPTPPPPPAPPPAAAFYWIDLADGLAEAIGDAPPDFTFRHDGIDSWAWASRNGEMLIVEPGREGVVQYYFYRNETAPYLVREAGFSYGFDGTRLMQVYDHRGRLVEGDVSWRQADLADRLNRRGQALLAAAWRRRSWSGRSE
ncbi:MAG: hypothetical protein J0M19_10615, partial [Sphingomonadales bacterium]|nr:hypothetical protein [Sphingomonadales bacterium]